MLAVSAIIPTFNRAGLVGETIEAVLGQSAPPAEILVVDDGSTDDTAAALSKFETRIRVVSQPNGGKPSALNRGLSACAGEAVWIVDDDDLPRPDALETLSRILTDNPKADLAYGPHDRFTFEAGSGEKRFLGTGYWQSCRSEAFLIATMEDFFAHQPGMLTRRALYDRAGPFDTDLKASEDYDMLIRLARIGRCVGTDRIIFDQRIHEGLRGQAGAQYTLAERDGKWREWDRRIFSKLRADMTLDEFLPADRREEFEGDAARQREALLQRGVVMMRRGMWDEALEDFEEAARREGAAPLSDPEKACLRRGFGSKYGIADILEDQALQHRIAAFGKTGEISKAVVQNLARGLIWRIRDSARSGRLIHAARVTGMAARLGLRAGGGIA